MAQNILAPVNFPQTAPLLSQDPSDTRAAALNHGEAFRDALKDASIELEQRKVLGKRGLASEAEIVASRRRLVAIETVEAQMAYGVGDAGVATAITQLTNQMNQMANQMNERMNQMTNQMNETNERMNQMTNQMNETNERLSAQISNISRRARNSDTTTTWTPILVERSGPNAVNTIPATFPANMDAVLVLTHPQIDALQAAYNLQVGHFGVQGTDEIGHRRRMVLQYFTVG